MNINWKKYDSSVCLKTGCYLTIHDVKNLDKSNDIYGYINISNYYEKDTLKKFRYAIYPDVIYKNVRYPDANMVPENGFYNDSSKDLRLLTDIKYYAELPDLPEEYHKNMNDYFLDNL